MIPFTDDSNSDKWSSTAEQTEKQTVFSLPQDSCGNRLMVTECRAYGASALKYHSEEGSCVNFVD